MKTHAYTSTSLPLAQTQRYSKRSGSSPGSANRAAGRMFRTAAVLLLAGVTSATHRLNAQVPADSAALFDQARAERRQQHLQEFLFEHSDANGNPRPDSWLKGIQDTRNMSVVNSIALAPSGLSPEAIQIVGVAWQQIGPAPLRIDDSQYQGHGPDSGEVTDIAIDPRNSTDQVVYIAANDGGIWKTTDGGASWRPMTDTMPSLSMGAVALDPGNPSIVYAGTGNQFNNGFFKGVGVYVSSDEGNTWSIPAGSSFLAGAAINRIVLPAPGTLLVGTGKGLFKSVDSGAHYGNNPPLFNNGQAIVFGEVDDIDLDTQTAGTVYACVNGVGLLRSTDSGSTFGGSIFDANVPAVFKYLSFAQSKTPNNQTMYVNMQTGSSGKVFKSINGGTSWSELPAGSAEAASCQCGYDQTVGVDPLDANRVYIAYQQLYESKDGGTSFANISTCGGACDQIHWDHHAMVFSPHLPASAPTRVWLGTDGGVSWTDNDGSSFTSPDEGIATCLFRGIDIGRGNSANNAYTFGGCQDTGIIEHQPGFPGADWHQSIDGDGGPTVVDPTNPQKAYSSDDGVFTLTSNAGNGWSSANSAASGLPDCGGSLAGYGCASPVGVDPNSPATIYAVNGPQLFRSQDTGSTFTSIKTFGSSIRAFANVQIDSNVAWLALNNNTLQRTANLLAGTGAAWTQFLVAGSAGLPAGAIAIDPLNSSEVVVVYQGFSNTGPGLRTKHAFLTTDNGTNWVDISGTDFGNPANNLPDLPLNSVVIDPTTSPHTIIVGSDAAVMRTSDLGATWYVLGAFLPTVQVTSLALDSTASPTLLRAGTYGRSSFQLVQSNLPAISLPGNVNFPDTCVGTTNFATLNVCNVGSADLLVGPITSTNSQFAAVPPTSGYPVTISPDFCYPFRVQFNPTSAGAKQTAFSIPSNDPLHPTNIVLGFGNGVGPTISSIIADSGSFGDVCLGSYKDLNLTINNAGGCALYITSILSTLPGQFLAPTVVSYPLVLQPGDSIALPVRFQPTGPFGPRTGNIIVASNDPSSPNRLVAVSGNVPSGTVAVTGSTDFGDVCAGTLAEKTISICNVGKCDLHVTSAALNPGCTNFTLINNPFPATVSPDACLQLVVQFTPSSCGSNNCTLVITSDDPVTPTVTLAVTANAPCAAIDVPPDLGFAPEVITNIGPCSEPLPFPISNKGKCNLTITAITIGGANAGDFGLAGLPSFPIILQPGDIVGAGDLQVTFAPSAVARARTATISVTYVSDPISGATTTVTRNLCGEGVLTGARVLVMAGGVPLAVVDKIQLQRLTVNKSGDVVQQAPLVTVLQSAPCGSFQYHREYGTVSNPVQLLAGDYQVTVSATINGKHKSLSASFSLNTCDFNPTVVINF